MPVRDFWNCLESLLLRFYMLSKVVPTGNAHFIVSGKLGEIRYKNLGITRRIA